MRSVELHGAFLFAIVLLSASFAVADDPPSVQAIAAMLPEKPCGFGRPLHDRGPWKALARKPDFQAFVRRAERLLREPLPASPDDLFLDFSRTGNRRRWERVAGRRRGRIGTLTLAECLEDRGRFPPALVTAIKAVCAEPTWVMPAHDRGLRNFRAEQIDIDLGAAHLAWNLALADWLLGDRLPDGARKQVRANLRRRIFDPYLAMLDGKRKPNWWLGCTNNWNAVCLAGVTGAALAVIESRVERARFVRAACVHSKNFLRGFTADGYCSEGLGYWGYGFGYFTLLAESVQQATGGRIRLLDRKAAQAPATFAARIQIVNGVSPAFADCGVFTRPSWRLVHFLRRRLGLGGDGQEDSKIALASSRLAPGLMYSFPNSATGAPAAEKKTARPELRSWFPDAGVLVCRPCAGVNGRFGAAMKGGHNAEHHNHNDVGSFVVVVGSRPVLVDPGSEVYTARTFSSRRYESKVLNSYGHPVPVPAGKLQRTGKRASARIVRKAFTAEADTLALDLRAAYGLRTLKELVRTFVFSRAGEGALTVTDRVGFSKPVPFETAILTLGRWRQEQDGSLFVWDLDEAVRVKIDARGVPFEVVAEVIDEDVRTPAKPTRIAIRLARPVRRARITLTITPVGKPAGAQGLLLRNGGFETEDWCWRIPQDGLAAVSDERAFEGRHALKITDSRRDAGSSVTSARIPVTGDTALVIGGHAFGERGSKAVGIYVKAYDRENRLLNPKDGRGNIAPAGVVGGNARKWESFRFSFRTPAATVSMEVWIHSMNRAAVTAWLDGLTIERQ